MSSSEERGALELSEQETEELKKLVEVIADVPSVSESFLEVIVRMADMAGESLIELGREQGWSSDAMIDAVSDLLNLSETREEAGDSTASKDSEELSNAAYAIEKAQRQRVAEVLAGVIQAQTLKDHEPSVGLSEDSAESLEATESHGATVEPSDTADSLQAAISAEEPANVEDSEELEEADGLEGAEAGKDDVEAADSAESDETLEGDLSPSEDLHDVSDEGEWVVAEIADTDELEAIEADSNADLDLDSAPEDEDHHADHAHQILAEELRGLGDYEGAPATEEELSTIALIAEGILYSKLSEVLLTDLLAEAEPLIRKARAKGEDWWASTNAIENVTSLLCRVLTGADWGQSESIGFEVLESETRMFYLRELAGSYPLDPEPPVELEDSARKHSEDESEEARNLIDSELSRGEKLKRMSISERYELLLSERGERNSEPLTGMELLSMENLVEDYFSEKPTEGLVADVTDLLTDAEISSARLWGWRRALSKVTVIVIELLLGADRGVFLTGQSAELRALIRTYKDSEMTEDEFIAHYDQSRWPSVGATVDLSIFTILDNKLQVLLIERGNHPEKGKWALPGGFVNVTESLDDAAARELQEETGVNLSEGGYLEQVKTYGYPGRDRRGYIVSTLYAALIAELPEPLAGDDAAKARFVPVKEALSGELKLAFDHAMLLRDALERVRAKLEYSPIVFDFLPDRGFTMEGLRKVYETVWGFEILPSDFRRRLSQAQDSLGLSSETSVDGKLLWVRGTADNFFPPLDRKLMIQAMEDHLAE